MLCVGGVWTHPSGSALRASKPSQRRAWSTARVSRAEETARLPNPATVRGEPERRPPPGQLDAPAAHAHAAAAQPVPLCTVRAIRALLADVRPSPPLCDGSVSRLADGASKPPPHRTQVRVRALGALRMARGRVCIAPPRRVRARQASLPARARIRVPRPALVRGARGARFEGGTAGTRHWRVRLPRSTISWELHDASALHDIPRSTISGAPGGVRPILPRCARHAIRSSGGTRT